MSEFNDYSSPLVRGLWLALRGLRLMDLREKEKLKIIVYSYCKKESCLPAA